MQLWQELQQTLSFIYCMNQKMPWKSRCTSVKWKHLSWRWQWCSSQMSHISWLNATVLWEWLSHPPTLPSINYCNITFPFKGSVIHCSLYFSPHFDTLTQLASRSGFANGEQLVLRRNCVSALKWAARVQTQQPRPRSSASSFCKSEICC